MKTVQQKKEKFPMNQFYLLIINDEHKYRYAYKDASLLGIKKSVCNTCGRELSSWSFDGSHRLVSEGGAEYPDRLMFTGAGGPLFILSDTAVQAFEKNGITGISESSPIDILQEEALPLTDAPPQYMLAQISGKIELDFKKMGLKKKKLCASCGRFEWNRQRLYPLFLNEETWDGSDFCKVESIPGYIICTNRVVQLVKEQKLKGFCFKAI